VCGFDRGRLPWPTNTESFTDTNKLC
jgi:hypothetical protein